MSKAQKKPAHFRTGRKGKAISKTQFDTLEEQQKQYGILSDMAYKGTLREKKKYLRETGLSQQYNVDKQLSNKHNTILFDDNGRAVVSIRGTKDGNDVATDLALALGFENLTKRYRDQDKLIEKVIDKYGRENVVLTAHSLGASIADSFGRKHDLEVHAFNAGSSPAQVRGELLKGRFSSTEQERENIIHHYIVPGDPISANMAVIGAVRNQRGDDKTQLHFVEQTASNPHTVENFT